MCVFDVGRIIVHAVVSDEMPETFFRSGLATLLLYNALHGDRD